MRLLLTFLFLLCGGYVVGQNVATKYVEQYKNLAVEQMQQHGVPASVVLGVAIHESGSGTSKIAQNLNNHFGMKGLNTNKQFKSSYKSYDSVAVSYQDFSLMLKSRKQFSSLFVKCSPYDYGAWVWGMQKGRYAASKLWASQVIAIIKKYKLYQYDNRPANYVEPVYMPKGKVVVKPARAKKKNQVYVVKSGDSLSLIAKKHHTTVEKLRKQNHLKTDALKVGQKLKTNSR